MKYPEKYYVKARIRDNARWHSLSPEEKLNKTYKRNYNVSYNDVKQMYDDQQGLCGACEDPITLGRYTGVVDHCHNTNKIRGVVCPACNKALGFVYDDTNRLNKLISYLEKHSGTGLEPVR